MLKYFSHGSYAGVGNVITRLLQQNSKKLVLGIESTFDDSGAAVIDENGKVLGEGLRSQISHHKSYGGVRPDIAMKLHEENIPIVVEEAMSQANVGFEDLSAIATATRPGFSLSLKEGLKFSKTLIKKYNLPFIPVHHMEAHALTARSIEKIDFPFLVLLASGGHCLLCLALGLGEYQILGSAMDEPPGAVIDKVARELKFLNEEKYDKMSGGRIIQELASEVESRAIPFTVPLTREMNKRTMSCNYSFSGLQTQVQRKIKELRESNELDERRCREIAAGFQEALVQHLVNQVHRAVIYCRMKHLIPDPFKVVISGGVSANNRFRQSLSQLCDSLAVKLICPPRHLCTDNGIMIAWTGMEYLLQGVGIAEIVDDVDFEAKSPIGTHVGYRIIKENIQLPSVIFPEKVDKG